MQTTLATVVTTVVLAALTGCSPTADASLPASAVQQDEAASPDPASADDHLSPTTAALRDAYRAQRSASRPPPAPTPEQLEARREERRQLHERRAVAREAETAARRDAAAAAEAAAAAGSGRTSPAAPRWDGTPVRCEHPVERWCDMAETLLEVWELDLAAIGWHVVVATDRPEPRTAGIADATARQVVLYPTDGWQDGFFGHVLAHEAGHAFDRAFFDDSDRARWQQLRGIPPGPWRAGKLTHDHTAGAEDLAEAFAWSLTGRPVRSPYGTPSTDPATEVGRLLARLTDRQ